MNPTPHSPLPIPHSPLHIPHSPLPIPHSALPIPHSPLPIPHSALPIPHSPLPIPHSPLPPSRRAWLQHSGCGFGMLALAGLMNDHCRAESAPGRAANPFSVLPPHFPPRAKRVIFLY
ncbi:MAG: hypothetical protein RLY70_1187, partial [Planctomycetota bacterium]